MYKISLILPGTKEGMEELRKRYARLMAKATAETLSHDELKYLIEKLEANKQ
ncbi:hypothetical protein [Clostridium saccharoperbutylacetonicum]|uniref:hypothetical protein n=1 Tax=Clostridium saccharoperbutylacetonicum TaxID=36745 RepID=UPI0039E7BDBB